MLRQILAAVLVAGCASAAAKAQEPVTLSLLDNAEGTVSDQDLKKFLEGRLAGAGLDYAGLSIRDFDRNVACSTLTHRTIATLNAAGYLRCLSAIGDEGLIPLFFVEKNGEGTPLYAAAFVAGATSPIDSVESPEVRRLLLGNPSSTSSFIAPLYHLWKSDVITQPTPAAAAARGWEVVTLTDAEAIRARLGRDDEAIGSFGLPGTARAPAGLKVIDRYDVLPQDVLFISKDLRNDRRKIESWLMAALQDPVGKDLVARHAGAITGLVPYEEHDEGQRALGSLRKMQREVARYNDGTPPTPERNLLPLVAVPLGVVLILAGIIFFTRAHHGGPNTLRLFGIEISVANPALMLILVGVLVVLIGLGAIKLPGGS